MGVPDIEVRGRGVNIFWGGVPPTPPLHMYTIESCASWSLILFYLEPKGSRKQKAQMVFLKYASRLL
jgi:hypothetical protein